MSSDPQVRHNGWQASDQSFIHTPVEGVHTGQTQVASSTRQVRTPAPSTLPRMPWG